MGKKGQLVTIKLIKHLWQRKKDILLNCNNNLVAELLLPLDSGDEQDDLMGLPGSIF